METFKVVGSFGRIVVAAAGLAAVVLVGREWLAPWLSSVSLIDRLWSLLAIIGAAAVVYFGLCALLRVEEAREALALIRRKISRRGIASPGA